MLGGADNPNGELPSYITGADTGKASKQAYKNLEKMMGKKYDLNVRLKSLYPSVRRTDQALSSQMMQQKHPEGSKDTLMANTTVGNAKKVLNKTSDLVKHTLKIVPPRPLAGDWL